MPTDVENAMREGTGGDSPPHHPRRSERRSGRSRFHLPERRTGFDRRRQYPLTGTLRDNPALILGVLVLINALSALDFGLTYAEIQAGVAAEGNPLLAGLFAAGPGQAWLFKGSVMLLVSLIIWHQRKHRAMLAVALLALGLYVMVLAYHLSGLWMSGNI